MKRGEGSMVAFSGTNIGLSRNENQDRVKTAVIADDAVFAVICDGMGGENAGSEASEKAINVIFDRVTKVFRRDYDNNSLKNLLLSAVTTANAVVYDVAWLNEEKQGMGTTCVLALVTGNRLYVVNVGDSRAYLINDEIIQITKDHTMVMKMYEKGQISKDEIKNHPHRNYLTKAVGVSEQVVPDYYEMDFSADSALILCSDGLSNYCDEDDIFNIVKSFGSEEIPEQLIKTALDNGGNDNISVAVIR